MNRYGNKYGFHNTKLTEVIANIFLESIDHEFSDGSWHNDCADSFHFDLSNGGAENYLEVYLPTTTTEPTNTDEEVYADYNVIDHLQNVIYTTEDINEIIEFVNNYIMLHKSAMASIIKTTSDAIKVAEKSIEMTTEKIDVAKKIIEITDKYVNVSNKEKTSSMLVDVRELCNELLKSDF